MVFMTASVADVVVVDPVAETSVKAPGAETEIPGVEALAT